MKGVYKITNTVNSHIYIGSSNNVSKRFGEHERALLRNKHSNTHMQHAWNKYGEDNFVFEVVLLCEEHELMRYEQWYLDRLNPNYNIATNVYSGMSGRKHSDETKHKISNSHKEAGNWVGTRHPKSILKEDDVKNIISLYTNTQATMGKLGTKFGVNPSTISDIIQGRTWKHITGGRKTTKHI